MPKHSTTTADGSVTVIKYEGEEKIHNLWPSPISISKPFSDEFLAQLKKDVRLVTPRATQNHIDIWSLPDLPDTMIAVKEKMLETSERVFKPLAEVPMPPLRIAKGYFRHTFPDAPYRITPHHHGATLGAGIFYVDLSNTNPGYLVFIDPRGGVNYTNQFSCFKRIKIEEGMMVIAPGYLIHFVEPTDYQRPVYDAERLLIVSNIHRMYEDHIQSLKEHDMLITSMGQSEL